MKSSLSHPISRIALLLLAGLAALACAPAAAATTTPKDGFTYNGVDYVSWWYNEYQESQGVDAAVAIQATGANYATVLVTQYVTTYTSTTIAANSTQTPTDAAVVAAITDLQAQGIKVFLKPHVDSLDGTWRGSLAPTSAADWFASYKTFILHYAKIASDNNAEGLIVGTELATLSGSAYESYWDDIISTIRTDYPSLTLTYGANATSDGDEFTTVSFWDKLDLIGVDGYFPLTDQADPTVAQLVSAWTDNKDGFNPVQALKTLHTTYSKPVIFTELGYESTAGTNEEPWDSSLSDGYDPTEQQNCYEAFFEVFSQQSSWMYGVFWWDWTVSAPVTDDTGYSPENKPAGDTTLVNWYGPAESFTLAPASSTLAVTQGSSNTDTISITDAGGFAGSVTLAATDLPSGVTAAFATNPTTSSSVLTLTTSSTATTGQATVTINGTSGSLTASTTITLTVNAAPVATFSLTPSPSSLTITQGDSKTTAITVDASQAYTSSVTLTAAVTTSPSGAVNIPTLSFGSTSPVSFSAATSGSATLTVTTTAESGCTSSYQRQQGIPWYTGGGAALACVLLFGVPARRRKWRNRLGVLALLAILAGGLAACGGGSSSRGSSTCTAIIAGTTKGSYTITVTAASGTTTLATQTIALTVD
jgi:hypothetical protein